VRASNNIEQWVKFFLTGVIATARNSKETLEKIILLRKQYDEKILTLGRKAKLAREFLLVLFSTPTISINTTAERLQISFNAASRLVQDFKRLHILDEVTGLSRNRLFALSEYLMLFR
jgi:hypothetical protein